MSDQTKQKPHSRAKKKSGSKLPQFTPSYLEKKYIRN
jgi:hypothetical protein